MVQSRKMQKFEYEIRETRSSKVGISLEPWFIQVCLTNADFSSGRKEASLAECCPLAPPVSSPVLQASATSLHKGPRHIKVSFWQVISGKGAKISDGWSLRNLWWTFERDVVRGEGDVLWRLCIAPLYVEKIYLCHWSMHHLLLRV